MSTYKYSLNNYHAISKAEISIDGITVLAGDNGCGKSTLAHWLYYLVNTSSRFDNLLFIDYKEQLSNLLLQGRLISRELNRYLNDSLMSDFFQISYRFNKIIFQNEESVKQLTLLFNEALRLLQEGLKNNLLKINSESRIQRINRYLHLDLNSGDNLQSNIDNYIDMKKSEAETALDEYNYMVQKRPIRRFFDFIHSNYRTSNKEPKQIQLSEDGVQLFQKEEFGNLLGLDRAIYVDTPMSLNFGDDVSGSVFWEDLRTMMMTESISSNDSNAKKLLIRIRKLIGGDVKVQELTYDKELHYIREKDNLEIRLEDTATGLKSFAYIQRLIENGYLNNHTILLIDEPEAHLHPKWIFEFARILVLIYKTLGTKIMLASHNPDMVAALQKIAQKEDVIEHTHFYQSYQEDDGLKFWYKDLGGEINEIFHSFNIATSRIQDYGEQG